MTNLPADVLSLLKKGKFAHLGTSHQDIPNVSLMNYTYIAPGEGLPYEKEPLVIVASLPNTQKYNNIKVNPNVSLLVHDWTSSGRGTESSLSTAGESLSKYLQSLNQNEFSSLSATFSGHASLLSGEEADFFKQKLLQDNNQDAKCFIESATVIAIKIHGVKVTDKNNQSQTYNI